jgi:hypothetical protein
MAMFEFKYGIFRLFYLYLCSCVASCLSCGVKVTGVAWWAATRIVAGVGDLVQRTGDGCTCQVLGARMIERSGDAECGLYRAQRGGEHGFLGSALKPRSTVCGIVCQWFGLKITGTGSPDLA